MQAILQLYERSMELAPLEVKFVVNWDRYAEILTAEDLVELAELAQKYPTGGRIVFEMAWKLHNKDRGKGVERVGTAD
jgi:hypothetical protein